MARSSYGSDLKARNSVKNTFATIASRYASKPSSLDQILADADFKRLFPNAKKVGFDKIDFGGVKSDFESGTPVGIVDVLTAADPNTDTARGWWWGYDAGGTGPTTYRPDTSGSGTQGATGGSLPTYDRTRFGTEALKKTPEERGWFTLAELGFTGDRANETPEDIYQRNREASATDNTAQYWDMAPVTVPKYEENYIGQRASERNRKYMGRALTLASLFAGLPGLSGGGAAAAAPRSSLGNWARNIRF